MSFVFRPHKAGASSLDQQQQHAGQQQDQQQEEQPQQMQWQPEEQQQAAAAKQPLEPQQAQRETELQWRRLQQGALPREQHGSCGHAAVSDGECLGTAAGRCLHRQYRTGSGRTHAHSDSSLHSSNECCWSSRKNSSKDACSDGASHSPCSSNGRAPACESNNSRSNSSTRVVYNRKGSSSSGSCCCTHSSKRRRKRRHCHSSDGRRRSSDPTSSRRCSNRGLHRKNRHTRGLSACDSSGDSSSRRGRSGTGNNTVRQFEGETQDKWIEEEADAYDMGTPVEAAGAAAAAAQSRSSSRGKSCKAALFLQLPVVARSAAEAAAAAATASSSTLSCSPTSASPAAAAAAEPDMQHDTSCGQLQGLQCMKRPTDGTPQPQQQATQQQQQSIQQQQQSIQQQQQSIQQQQQREEQQKPPQDSSYALQHPVVLQDRQLCEGGEEEEREQGEEKKTREKQESCCMHPREQLSDQQQCIHDQQQHRCAAEQQADFVDWHSVVREEELCRQQQLHERGGEEEEEEEPPLFSALQQKSFSKGSSEACRDGQRLLPLSSGVTGVEEACSLFPAAATNAQAAPTSAVVGAIHADAAAAGIEFPLISSWDPSSFPSPSAVGAAASPSAASLQHPTRSSAPEEGRLLSGAADLSAVHALPTHARRCETAAAALFGEEQVEERRKPRSFSASRNNCLSRERSPSTSSYSSSFSSLCFSPCPSFTSSIYCPSSSRSFSWPARPSACKEELLAHVETRVFRCSEQLGTAMGGATSSASRSLSPAAGAAAPAPSSSSCGSRAAAAAASSLPSSSSCSSLFSSSASSAPASSSPSSAAAASSSAFSSSFAPAAPAERPLDLRARGAAAAACCPSSAACSSSSSFSSIAEEEEPGPAAAAAAGAAAAARRGEEVRGGRGGEAAAGRAGGEGLRRAGDMALPAAGGGDMREIGSDDAPADCLAWVPMVVEGDGKLLRPAWWQWRSRGSRSRSRGSRRRRRRAEPTCSGDRDGDSSREHAKAAARRQTAPASAEEEDGKRQENRSNRRKRSEKEEASVADGGVAEGCSGRRRRRKPRGSRSSSSKGNSSRRSGSSSSSCMSQEGGEEEEAGRDAAAAAARGEETDTTERKGWRHEEECRDETSGREEDFEGAAAAAAETEEPEEDEEEDEEEEDEEEDEEDEYAETPTLEEGEKVIWLHEARRDGSSSSRSGLLGAAGSQQQNDETLFWRGMPAGKRLRWAATRIFRVDTHSILALPIFLLIVSILSVEAIFYIGIRLAILLTETFSFYAASAGYWLSHFCRSGWRKFSPCPAPPAAAAPAAAPSVSHVARHPGGALFLRTATPAAAPPPTAAAPAAAAALPAAAAGAAGAAHTVTETATPFEAPPRGAALSPSAAGTSQQTPSSSSFLREETSTASLLPSSFSSSTHYSPSSSAAAPPPSGAAEMLMQAVAPTAAAAMAAPPAAAAASEIESAEAIAEGAAAAGVKNQPSLSPSFPSSFPLPAAAAAPSAAAAAAALATGGGLRGENQSSSFWWSCVGGVRSAVAAAAGIFGRALATLLLLRYYKKPLYQLARLPAALLRYVADAVCSTIGSSHKKTTGQHSSGASLAQCSGDPPATAAAAAGRGGGKPLAGSLQQQQRHNKPQQQQQQRQDRPQGAHGRSRSSTSSSTSSSQDLLTDMASPEAAAAAAPPPPPPAAAAARGGGGEKKAAPQQRPSRRHPCAGCRRRSNNNPPGSFSARHSQGLPDDPREWEFTGTSLISHRASLLKAKTYEEYRRLALIMDRLTGRERWKYELESSLYDYEAVGKRVKMLQKARRSGRVEELQEALCASMRDQMLGVFKEKLYSRTYIGTKQQIELFIDEVCGCLTDLQQHVPTHAFEIAKTVQQLQSLWGVTGLVLSGGASLGLHHFGVLEVLLKTQVNGKNFIPKVVGGCSAGAVVAAWLCTRTDEELLRQGNAEFLTEHWQGLSPNSWLLRLWNVLTKGYMCDMDVWRAAAKKLFGDLTFLEAYQRTGRVLNISMTRADREEAGVKVMNYANAPNVLIWSALLCSCAFPFLSLPMPLREKNERGEAIISKSFGCSYFHDGSLSGDIPTEQIRDAWGVSYSIVSQVNLHVFPFAGLRTHGEAGIPVHWRGRSSRWRAGFLLSALELFFKEHIRFLLRLIALLDVSPTLRGINAGSLALQSYTGDVTLHPRYISPRYLRLLNDSSPSDIRWYLQEGRLMVFPKLHLISNRMRVDRCLENLRMAVHRVCSQERRSE